MAKSRVRFPKNYAQARSHFILEKHRVEKHFPFFRCELHRDRLLCQGVITPLEGCESYHIKIEYNQGRIPRVYIVEPVIKPSSQYHMYGNGCLCLYDYREAPWSAKMKIHETIIPWTAEWLIFYELWKISGEWMGPAAPHGTGEKVPETIR